MSPSRSIIALISLLLSLAAATQDITLEKAAQLAQQFLPDPVRTFYSTGVFDDSKQFQNPLEEIERSERNHQGSINYLSFQMTGDPAQYVLLAWGGHIAQGAYLRLLKSTDGGQTFVVAQDLPYWYQPVGWVWNVRLQDITGDGVPELLLESEDDMLVVFAWRSGAFVCVTPPDPEAGTFPPFFETSFHSSGGVELEDADGDGKAEVVVYAWVGNERDDPNSDESWHTVYYGTTKIYKYNGTAYVLWKELPATDSYPVNVPSIAVIHPGTLPLSELSSPGNGDLQVFVSHPAGTNTVDDMDASTLTYNGTKLDVKKRWPNTKQPSTASANWEWGGCPVKQTAPKGQGEWNPSPEDPYLPSPDGKTDFHFVAPYLEFRLARSAVFPYLLQAATAAFAKDPSRQTYFVEIPISGKMKSGKLAAISALVCVKKTGPAAAPSTPQGQPSQQAPAKRGPEKA